MEAKFVGSGVFWEFHADSSTNMKKRRDKKGLPTFTHQLESLTCR